VHCLQPTDLVNFIASLQPTPLCNLLSIHVIRVTDPMQTSFPTVDRQPERVGPRRFFVTNLVWPVAITSVILLFSGIGGAWYVLQLQKSASNILAWNVTSIRAAEELEISVREMRSQLNRFLLTGDVDQLQEIPNLQPECEHWLAESVRLARSPEEKAMMSTAEQGYSLLRTEIQQLLSQPITGDTPAIVSRIVEDGPIRQIIDHAHQYLDHNERELASSSEHNQNLAERLALSLLLIGVCGAVAGLLAGFSLARGVIKSIVQISLPIHDVAGQLNEVVGPISVTGSRRLEDLDETLRTLATRVSTVIERLRQRERDAVRADQLAALGQLAAGLAHELRNPLMSMKILVQSALSEERGHLEGTDLDVLADEIARLEKLVSTFLDFARPSSPSKFQINLADVARQTLELVSRQANLRGVTLHCEQLPEVIRIEADPAQLRQLFLNLLLNALDAARQGGEVWVDIQPPGEHSADGMVAVSIADNGHGFAENLKESIFDPFVSSKTTGIGLGLTICRHIVEAHGGRIDAEDRAGGGAVFRLRLPLIRESIA